MNRLRRNLSAAFALAMAALATGHAFAEQPYPNKPIKLVVPYPPGGTADVIARLVGAKMGDALGQPVVVENKSGAGGNIGTDAVAKAPADGYTALLGTNANLAINPALYRKIPFDVQKDFVPVLALGSSPNVLVVNPSVQASTVKELVALAKSRSTPLLFASGGNGSTGHLAMEMFQDAAGIKVRHVPYRGGPAAVTDLIGGQVEAIFFPAAALLQHVRSGRLKAISVASPVRSSVMPEVPTIAESGVPGVDASGWYGLFVPAGTSPTVIAKLHAAAAKGLSADDVRRQFAAQGIEPMTEAGDAFANLVKADLVRWAAVVKQSGATID